MKRIQIALSDNQYKQAKQVLAGHGMSWQTWGTQAVNQILSEAVDSFGEPVPLNEMAVDRSQFETKIQEKLVGALREQAFVLLAEKNGQSKWVEHKKNEVERLLLEMVDVFDLKATGKWSKYKVAVQAIEYYRDKLKTYVTKAMNQYPRYYKEQPKKKIFDKDLEPLLDQALSELPKE